MQLPAYDVEVVVEVQADTSVWVGGKPVMLKTLTQTMDAMTAGQRAKVEVLVWPPHDESPAFVDFIRAVQATLRRTKDHVVFCYHTEGMASRAKPNGVS